MKPTKNTTLSLSRDVGSDLQIPLLVCEMVITEFFKKVKGCLKAGEPVSFTGLGSLCVKTVKPRKMFNVAHGKYEVTKEKQKAKFKQSKVLDLTSS